MNYPTIHFKREQAVEPESTRWGAYWNGEYLGSVAFMPLGYWNQVNGHGGYSSRYEAAYSLLTAPARRELRCGPWVDGRCQKCGRLDPLDLLEDIPDTGGEP